MTQHGKGGLRRISTPHYESGLQEISVGQKASIR